MWLWLALSAAARANPLEWTGPLAARFAVSQWDVADGLPQSSVTDLAQSPDGYLYASTFGGLARFDGVRFLVIDPTRSRGLPSIRFTAVATEPDGRIWVGLEGGQVAELRGEQASLLPDPGEPALGPIHALLPLGGALWVAGRQGLARFGDGRWTRYDWPADAVTGGADAVWAGGSRGLARIDERGLVPVPIALPGAVGGLYPIPGAEQLWIATESGVEVRERDGAERIVYRLSPGAPSLGQPVPAVGPDGRVWLGHARGLDLLGSASDLLAASEPARSPLAHLGLADAVRVTRFDREGHLWLGTDLDGLLRVSPLPFDRHVPDRALHQSVQAMDASGDPVLVAPVCSGLWTWEPERGFGAVPSPPEASRCVGAVLRLRSGEALYGAEAGLYRVGEDLPVATFPGRVHALAEGSDGTLWVGTEAGAFTVRGGEVAPVSGSNDPVSVVVEAPDRAIWLGDGSGITVLRPDGTAERLDADDGLASAQIRAVRVDPDGTAWIGTYGGGLIRLAGGRAVRYTEATGLVENVISAIVDDGSGFFWLNGNRGVCRVSRADLDAVARGSASTVRALLFPTGEGSGGSWPSASADPSGDLWFATVRGAVALDPTAVFSNEIPPTTIIEEISVDGRSYPVEGGWEAPPGRRELSIRYTTAILGEPSLARFRYRLLPIEPDWRSAEGHREIHYAELAPGRYVFEVEAANEDGVWSEVPARARVRLGYRLTETRLFRLAASVGLLGAMLGVFQLWSLGQRSRNAALQAEIGQRRRVESALRTSEAHYRSVFEAASDGLLVVDPDGVVQDANRAASALFGQPEGTLRGKRRDTLVEVGPEHHRGICADGSSFPARVSTVPLGDGRELTSVVDLGPMVALQDRLANAQRMEAIGRLAGGVAHDFNNLLTVVRANAVSLRSSLKGAASDPGPMLESIDHIESVAQRGSDLTRQLLAFGQRQLLRPEPVDISELVLRIEGMLRRLVRDGLVLEVRAPEPCVVRADPTQTELALVNLVLNAIDAISGAGRIEVAVRRVPDAEARQRWPVRSGADWVVLTVADTGTGIPQEILPHVFEPFFTTKGGQGSGLGLASVHGFVTQSQGYVFVRSTRGEGSVFDMVLPAGAGRPDPRRLASIPPRDPRVAASVVVCDDDALVRRTVERLLKNAGYQVRGADAAAAALDLLREEPADLLVTDVLMPGVTGIELAARARELQLGLRVVFVSGYTSEVLPSELDGPLVSKPFEPAAFLDVIRRTLR